jgi:hypothetical protein
MVSSSAAAAAAAANALPPRVSQELFDDTVLENEECFDLSPDDALRETIDQFRRQLGPVGVVNHPPPPPRPSSTSALAVPGGAGQDVTRGDGDDGIAVDVPAALSHLILSHPHSTSGKAERRSRRRFRDRLALLDGCVRADGTVRADDDPDAGAMMRALDEIGRWCRSGDSPSDRDNPGEESDDDDGDDFETADNGGGRIIAGGAVGGGGPYPNLNIFHQTSSIYTLMSFLGIVDPAAARSAASHEVRVLSATAKALSAILASNPDDKDNAACADVRSELRESFVPALGRLVCLVGGIVDAVSLSSTLCDLLRLGTDATRGCESAKVAWVRSVLPPNDGSNIDLGGAPTKRGGALVVVSCLSLTADDVGGARRASTIEACRLLASLCRYDDFRDVAGPGPNTSSAHDHAVEFHRAGASTLLIGIARVAFSSPDGGFPGDGAEATSSLTSVADERLASAALTALRVMAVNDEIIQTMVALGVLPITTEALRRVAASDAAGGDDRVRGRKQRFAAAALGLLRNLCGNDEIKTNLCLGSSATSDRSSKSATSSVLPHVIRAMQVFPSTALVQEHACGTLAAMALRRAANARAIFNADGPRLVITAMKRHDGNVNVQRQGALAIRNIVSRLLRDLGGSDDARENSTIDYAEAGGIGDDMRSSIRDAFFELGAEDVLRNIAGRHQGSVDEAYAALRDLGCRVSLVKFNADDAGFSRTMMFGEKNNMSFRPVYEESTGLADGVHGAISQFGS